jgi:hypothetical protein
MFTCPKHKIPLKLQRGVKIRDLALTCPFCKVEKRAANSEPADKPTTLSVGDLFRSGSFVSYSSTRGYRT